MLALGCVGVAAGQAESEGGELGVGGPHLAAGDPESPVDRSAWVVSEARSLPASGSLNSWHQSSSAAEDRREPPFLLLGRAVGEQRGCHQVDARCARPARALGPVPSPR